LIPGVELSTTIEGVDLHLLGYYFDWTYEPLLERLHHFQQVRAQRAEQMVHKLNQLGIDITYKQVQDIAGDGAIGRPHVAEALVQEGIVITKNEAFNRYIGYNGPAYVPKFKISPIEGIQLIREAGGVAVLAHPGTVKRDELIPRFVSEGLGGLEVIHPDHNETTTQHYIELARKHDLAMTGGSDFHGPNTNLSVFGKFTIPCAWLDSLRARCDNLR
jgi:predicted metal-dependent phosphoesterase TrpH